MLVTRMSDGGTHAENNENWERCFIVKQRLNKKISRNKFFVFCHSLIYIFLKDFLPSDFSNKKLKSDQAPCNLLRSLP